MLTHVSVKAFHQHNTTSPDGPETSAFSSSHWTQGQDKSIQIGSAARIPDSSSGGATSEQRLRNPRGSRDNTSGQQQREASRREVMSAAEAELLAILPSHPAAVLLVKNYFDKVHWFMLIFHQSDFRGAFRQLYRELDEQGPRKPTSVGLGFLSVLTAVFIISLRYIDDRQREYLCDCGIVADYLQKKLLNALRMRLLEVVAQGSIEAVQACVLLGSFYLYHGEPELAWPICGCGLRIAQALNLHRRRHQSGSTSCSVLPDLDDPGQRAEEARKRCWWAVYEIETTCSMLYGFPLNINDDDCDNQLLCPYPLRSSDASWDSTVWQQNGQATLLSYKHTMAQLSIIVKSALTDLYGLRQRRTHANSKSGATDRDRLQGLMASVTSLDKRLREWHARLPLQLSPASLSGSGSKSIERVSSIDDAGRLSDQAFQNRLFQLQALSLKVAYENAKILIHRPLLSYRMVVPPTNNAAATTTLPGTPDTCQSSIRVCRDAALEISNIGSLAVFQGVAETYAVSFVSLHLLTAAIALSILTTLAPLTQESHDCKMGIRRLMEMQSRLRARSIVAEQGLGILKKLMSLVLTKEMKEMLEFPRPGDEAAPAPGVIDERGVEDNLGGAPRSAEEARVSLDERIEACQAKNQSVDPISVDGVSVVIPPAAAGDVASQGFSFYEDPVITQALLDFEQGMYCLSLSV